ncbi:MAG: UbiA family prenyltransferase [Oscillochloridaceae bacterium]|nr:UbiA family prenyltransferase [Chloroflexaceae bacterium]MDW8390519.1 UbiA family prenyltransferase [Oscillochloridaceae bacterium]
MYSSPLRLAALLHVLRPHVAAQAAAYTFLGAYLSAGPRFTLTPLTALAALIVAVVVAFGFVINDYADADIDRLTKPERPIPSGAISRSQAVALARLLAGLTAVLILFAPVVLQAIAILNLALTTAYALVLKRTVLIGNATVALLNSSILVFGGLAAGGVSTVVWAVAGMSFLYSLAQEVLYTVDDVDGDARAGIMTTAVYFGVEPALRLFRGLIVLALLCATAPAWLAGVTPLYPAALLVCVALPVSLYILPRIRRYEPRAVRQACAAIKAVRIAGLAPLMLLGLPPG